jgi:hypothetical protein
MNAHNMTPINRYKRALSMAKEIHRTPPTLSQITPTHDKENYAMARGISMVASSAAKKVREGLANLRGKLDQIRE